LSGDEALRALKTRASGLHVEEGLARLSEFGPNQLPAAEWRHGLVTFVSQFTSPLVLILIAAAVTSYFLHQRTEATVILGIVLINGALGFGQEFRAEHALRRLRAFITRNATVRRGGDLVSIPMQAVVPGDIVHLEIGDLVPADLRLLAADDLSVDEAIVTGESVPVVKGLEPVSEDAQAYQLNDMALMGTSVASGYAEGVVVATGVRTVLGRTAVALEHKPHETDFQRSIRGFGAFLLKVVVALTVFVMVVNSALGKGIFDSFLFALALAVGITPEALPIIVTIALSRGALRMAHDQVVAKRLVSVEDLGNIDLLCCDKTGTLTEGRVALHDFVDLRGARSSGVLLGGLLTSIAPSERGAGAGDIIDRAIHARRDLVAEDLAGRQVLDRNAFDYRRRRASALVRMPDGSRRLYVKGAWEAVLDVCRLAGADAEGARALASTFERAGYRVLAVADRPAMEATSTSAEEEGLTLRGYLLLLDPPMAGAREALARFTELGVGIKVMSGDGPEVTRRICHDVGLEVRGGRVITGSELRSLDDDGVKALAARHTVFARVSPEDKARLVTALAGSGHVVGFLGDGVNDVPALRAADVGISVDSGADVAKDAADIVLLQKSLGVLAHGIRAGRTTFGNITKYILNTVSANFGNMTTVALSSLWLSFIPLLPSQILLNNLVSDVPLLALSTDRVDEDFLRKPRRWDIGLIRRFMLVFGLLSAVFDVVLLLGLTQVFHSGTALLRTAWFVESACSEIVVTFAIRTRHSAFRSPPGLLLLGLSAAFGGLAFVLPFTEIGRRYFQFAPLPGGVLWFTVGVLLTYFVAAELAKRAFFRTEAAGAVGSLSEL
jgi:Mg2+-importing ATPase